MSYDFMLSKAENIKMYENSKSEFGCETRSCTYHCLECKLTTLGNNLVILTKLKMDIPQRPINYTLRKDSRKPSNSNNGEECVLYPENNDTNMHVSLRNCPLTLKLIIQE